MKTNKLSIAILLGALFLVSCEKEIEFKGEETDPKLVINSLVEPGRPIKANITKSYFFLDNNPSTAVPDDLVATLYVNGHLVGEMTRQIDTIIVDYEYVDIDSVKPVYSMVPIFVNEYRPNPGDVVTITASANGYDDVEASTSPLPNTASWSVGNYHVSHWEMSFYEPYYEQEDTSWYIQGTIELTVEIADPNPGETNYFKMHVETGGITDYETGTTYYITATYDDPVFGGTNVGGIDLPMGAEGVFTDVLFDGRSYQIKVPLDLYVSYTSQTAPDILRMPITMEHLTKEYYYYLNTCEQASEIMQLFSEPVQTYTNVEGGYGLVGGRCSDTLWFEMPLTR